MPENVTDSGLMPIYFIPSIPHICITMNFELIRASKEFKDIIKNLMQFYIYDFSEFVPNDVESDGLFKPYASLDDYWQEEEHRFPYLIKISEKCVGFVLVRSNNSERYNYFSIAEFFVMRKYRRSGIGKAAAGRLFDLYKGNWEVEQRESNMPAQAFWRKVIADYTQGAFAERAENGRSIQYFKN